MPEMQRFHEKYGEEVEVLAVNLTGYESSKSSVNTYINKYKYTYPTILDKDLSVSNEYMIVAVPTTYFIGTDGKIQAPQKIGPMTYEYMVDMKQQLN